MTTLIIEADGGSRGNPGIAGAGALVRDTEGRILATKATPIGQASNNVAEYTGLIDGLTLVREIDPQATVEVRMDSKLVVEQMSGRWKIKHADMKRLAHQAAQILPLMNVTFTWIPRAKNGDADALSNEAMDAAAAGVDWDPETSRIQPAS
ncbi:reverse transcriptase-like protein [Nesterenkonia suensis]